MAGRSLGGAAALVVACTAALATGCGGDGEPDAPAGDSASPTVEVSRSSPATTDSTTASDRPDEGECSASERRLARGIWLWRAVDEVSGSPTGYSEAARQTVAVQTARAGRRLLQACGGHTSVAFDRFSSEIQSATAGERFGNHQLDEVLRAWLRWGSAVGTPEAASREIRDLEACRRDFFPLFDASYRIWWKVTETGRAWWVEITFDNRTGTQLFGSMGGRALATKMLEDPFGWDKGPKPGPGKTANLSWGGSSAEILVLRPGTTVQGVAPGGDLDVHTTVDGTFRVTEMEVGLQPMGESYLCTPPVHPYDQA